MENDQFKQVEEVINSMLEVGAIDTVGAQRYRQNHRYIHEQRPLLERTYNCAWVASVEGEFHARFYLNDLHRSIEGVPFSDRAYIEHIHPGMRQGINLSSHNIQPPRPGKPSRN